MSQTPRTVAVLVGSLRAASANRRLAERIAALAPQGVQVRLVDGLDAVPFYNEDLDQGSAPEAATALRATIAEADAVLAVTPEYNGSLPAVLKNALDWVSRPYAAGAIKGKPFAVVGVTPTPYGGRWAHADAVRSARVAGAEVVEELTASLSSLETDVLTDEATAERLTAVLAGLLDRTEDSAAA